MFSSVRATSSSRASAACAWVRCLRWNSRTRSSWDCFSRSVARASSSVRSGSPCGLRKVFTPMIGSEPSCLRCS
ncbi:Uncharacterised protein [Mycobacteroides abscessus subsp. abscessus]|nr:Uncharacterised protein [Mycobacteroides abscessus subsp. abscessus]